MRKILIDTDVILDFFFDRKPFSDNAAKFCPCVNQEKLKASSHL